ncbi:MAG: acyl-ACP--UDP-N-acetylglucosamine O-acyltransferase [Acidobacteriota bacterium]|nr:acyl-ACP--UDP-N-acetylglucosamine O-acyltransferase [Acidobacteriota bacterium]MDH3528892.1 acyl-ACP--UDP-N-acetylglucosamine O-acyltransferase [Acidobacteriota bacterium]
MNGVHPTAIVGESAKIGKGCQIGPYSTIGGEVVLGENVRVESHAVIDGQTTIGDGSIVYPFVSIGLAPQDLKYVGEASSTEIGKRNKIREFVTIHRGTKGGGGVTKIGDDNLIMAQAHVAHDCIIGNGVILANAATLAGHVEIGDKASIGAHSGVHQFCRIGFEAFVGGYSVVVKDAMPYALIQGNHAKCYGLNRVGMKRRGYPKETIANLNHAFHLLLSAKLNTTQAVERIEAEIRDSKEVEMLVEFIKSSERGVVK